MAERHLEAVHVLGLITRLCALLALIVVGLTACGGGSSSEADCGAKIDVILWGGTQWRELAAAMAMDGSPCAEYYISIPPQDSDKTKLRAPAEFKRLRALGENIHPVAEIRFTSESGWRAWVVGPHRDWEPGRTFYDAGVEVRRRMAQRGLDVAAGETWALNELSEEVRENVSGRREEIRQFLRGLYEGAEDMPDARGIVFDIGVFGDVTDATAYKSSLEAWLADEPFWRELDKYVEFFAEEVYAGPLMWGVPETPVQTRASHLNEYFFHMTTLAERGPDDIEAARAFLRRAYTPLMNAAWPHAGIGHTDLVPAEIMAGFVSTEVYAVSLFADAHPNKAPNGRMGFAWAPNAADPHYTESGRDMVLTALATALRATGRTKDGEPGPCETLDRASCGAEVEGAAFNDAWKIFASWD